MRETKGDASMRRIVWIGLLLAAVLQAETKVAEYVVEYGIFGKMGEARASLVEKEGRYRIEMKVWATGLAKVLSGGRVEIYTSEGIVAPDGRLVPETYAKDIRRSGKRRLKTYRFDHEHKVVRWHETKWRDGNVTGEKSETLPYYADNDIFTLYFNLPHFLKNCDEPFDRTFHAVGAEKKTGRVRIETLTGKARKEAESLLGKAPCYLRVTIYQKIFGSKGGKLYLAMREDHVVKKAVLKDVVMFGDVRGRLIKYRVEP